VGCCDAKRSSWSSQFTLPNGTLRSILRQAGLTAEELAVLL
jgi:hypothetical protein